MQASLIRAQRGYLMPMAIFIVVGLAALATAIAHLANQSGTSSFREALSVQALYSADSAAQWALNQLFFPSATRASADSACTSLAANLNFNAASMQGCVAALQCSIANDAANATSIYTVTSTASCGAGELLSERRVQVRAFISD